MDLRQITSSEIRTYRACPRRHHYAYDLLYRTAAEIESLGFGQLGHLGLEHWWGAESVEDCWQAMRIAATPEQSESVLVSVEEVIRGYDLRWRASEIEPLAVEAKFECQLKNPRTNAASRTFTLAGKIDLVCREAIRELIGEHKFTSEDITPGSDYWRRLQIDGQVSAYFVGATSLGYHPEACLYDVIRRPRLRMSQVPVVEEGAKVVVDQNGARVRTKDGKKWRETADTALGYSLVTRPETAEEFRARLRSDIERNLESYFARGEVVRLESEEQEALWDFWTTARQIRDGQLSERWPRNLDACAHWGRTCEYLDVCTGLISLDDPTRFRKAETPHEELAA